LFRLLELPRGSFDRPDNLVITGAAAEVSGEPETNLVLRGIGIGVKKSFRRHDEPRSANAALERRLIKKRLLKRMQLAVVSDSFDGRDLRALDFHREDAAGIDEAPVEDHRAGAAVAVVAALLGTRELELIAKNLKEALMRFAEEVDVVAIKAC